MPELAIQPPLEPSGGEGRLAQPTEEELVEAFDELRDEALTIPWAAERLGIGVAHVEALVRSGELIAIPGPWRMRRAHRSGLGFFLPGWQLDLDGDLPHPGLPAVIAAAAAVGWTTLQLHRFMIAPLGPDQTSPAAWLRAGEVERVVTSIHGESRPAAA